MSNRAKTFIIFIGAIGLAILPLPVFNVLVDPLGDLYWTRPLDKVRFRMQPAMEYIKTSYLADNPSKYDSLIFGNSRAYLGYDPKKLTKGKWYNFSWSGSNLLSFSQNFKCLLSKGMKIKTLILTLDDLTFTRWDYEKSKINNFQSEYSCKIINRTKDVVLRLFRVPDYKIIEKSFTNQVIEAFSETFTSGFFISEIKSGNGKKNYREWKYEPDNNIDFNFVEGALVVLRDIKTISDYYHVNTIVVFNPLYHEVYKNINKEWLRSFLTKLSEFTDYYDFSGENEITRDPDYFFEPIHFKPIVGQKVLDVIFSGAKNDKFGKYVPKGSLK